MTEIGVQAALAGTKRSGSMSIQHAIDFNRRLNPNHLRKTDVRIALGVLAGAVERYRLANARLERKLKEQNAPDFNSYGDGVHSCFSRISSGVHPRANHHWGEPAQHLDSGHPGVRVRDCTSDGDGRVKKIADFRDPWTGTVVSVRPNVGICDKITRRWPHVGSAPIRMDVVQAGVEDWRDLFKLADKLGITNHIAPAEWVHWLSEQVLLVNPHLRDQVERYTLDKEPSR